MQGYGPAFAKVYNALWGGFARQTAPLIHQFYAAKPIAQHNRTVLDLCCGTGQFAAHFLAKNYQVVGLDLSAAMLKFACANNLPFLTAQQAHFVQGDVTRFGFDQKFGLVVALFDALNHLPDLESLKGAFESAYRVLQPEGYFIFDLNTRLGLTHWNGVVVHPGDEIFYVNRSIYDDLTVKAWMKITGFVQNNQGLYERFDETVYNTVFSLAAVQSALAAAGYRQHHFARIGDLAQAVAEPESEPRIFCVAQK